MAIGIFGLTFLTLLVLKLTNLANISWFWVFMPLLIPFLIWCIGMIICFIIEVLD